MAFSPSSIFSALVGAGVPSADARTLTAVSGAESGFGANNYGDYNAAGDPTSFGVFQIHAPAWPGLGGSSLATADLSTQAQAAATVYNQQGLTAWSTYNSGAYQSYLPQVDASGQNVAPQGGSGGDGSGLTSLGPANTTDAAAGSTAFGYPAYGVAGTGGSTMGYPAAGVASGGLTNSGSVSGGGGPIAVTTPGASYSSATGATDTTTSQIQQSGQQSDWTQYGAAAVASIGTAISGAITGAANTATTGVTSWLGSYLSNLTSGLFRGAGVMIGLVLIIVAAFFVYKGSERTA